MNEQMNDNQIKHMVDRFLGWKLPDDFNPDGGISFTKTTNEDRPSWPQKNEPTGTNLFDADQAEEMVRYMVAEPSPEPEAAPASEAQATAVPDELGNVASDLSMLVAENLRLNVELAKLRAERDEQLSILDAVGPITCRDGVKHPRIDECLYCTIDALRARVAILDVQEVELPELDRIYSDGTMDFYLKKAIYRERQLLDALRAIQAKNELLRIASEELQEQRNLNGLPSLNHIGRWEHKRQMAYDALAGKDGE